MARILVVEDEPAVVMLMRFVLEKSGHEVSEARNGAEALKALGVAPDDPAAELPELVLLDVMMPVMDGLATARAMAAHARASKVPVLVVTAKGDLRALFEELPQVAGFFQKPFDPQTLREAIARAVSPR